MVNAFVDVAYEAQKKENEKLPILKKELAQTEKAIDNMLNAIQQGIITKSTKKRLADLEEQKQNIEVAMAKEQIQNPLLSKKQLHFLFDKIKQFDISKIEHRQKLIDIFVNCIIIYDDRIKFFFNYKNHTETISFDELNNCSDLFDSPRPKGRRLLAFIFFSKTPENRTKPSFYNFAFKIQCFLKAFKCRANCSPNGIYKKYSSINEKGAASLLFVRQPLSVLLYYIFSA